MFFVWRRGDLLQKIDVVSVVELIPIGDGAAALLGQEGDDALAEVGVEDFADANHNRFILRKTAAEKKSKCRSGFAGHVRHSRTYRRD